MMQTPAIEERLATERNIWFTTVRPDGRPHLVPLWFIWHEGKIYFCGQGRSVKIRNLATNQHVALALESGNSPVVIEGIATLVAQPWPTSVAAAFHLKYDWQILSDDEYDALVEIVPTKWLFPAS
jgi:F420H(2)-dependent biliverdin reductase